MTDQETLEVGNNIIDADTEFTAGYCNGSLCYYDRNRQLPQPLTSEAVHTFMMENLSDERETARWNAGYVVGWIMALCENNPAYFHTSIRLESSRSTEPLPALLQEA